MLKQSLRRRSTPTLEDLSLLHAQVQDVHRELDDYLSAWLRGLRPPSLPRASPSVALYVHAATVEDITIQTLLCGARPLFETTWAGRGPAEYSTADLGPVRRYAHDVFAATDAYLAGLRPGEAKSRVDLSRMQLGHPSVFWVVSRFVVAELAHICGELAAACNSPAGQAR